MYYLEDDLVIFNRHFRKMGIHSTKTNMLKMCVIYAFLIFFNPWAGAKGAYKVKKNRCLMSSGTPCSINPVN